MEPLAAHPEAMVPPRCWRLARAMGRATMVEGSLFSHFFMHRRDFLKMAGLAAASGRLLGQQEQSLLAPAASPDAAKTDFTLEIAPVTVELAPIASSAPSDTTAPRRG